MADEALTTQVRPPQAARIVVIGGGIMGCSVAYHLSAGGETDVALLEQGRLTSGTTWHAAGLVGQLRNHESMTRLIRYSTELYSRLEDETGLSTGWKQCGSMAVARTADRMIQLKRTAAVAQAFGVACDVITAAEAGERYPIMATADLKGGVWLPGDGKANPADLTLALAKGARNRGVRICEGVRVSGAVTHADGRRIAQLEWTDKTGSSGRIAADIVVLCGGQWSRALGRRLGVTVPLFSCEHYYIVTDVIPGVHRDLPVLRDPDGYIYFKEEVGGLLMGGFEPQATPWLQSAEHRGGIPENFEFQLLRDNWDAFQILLDNAMIRVPAFETAQLKQFYNGPESFTADNNFILGPAPGVDNLYVGCGFNSMGIASAGGAGKALAEWIVAGEPTLDLWPVDIRRFARFNGNESWLPDRIAEVLGMHYKMPWPNRELESARPFRRSPLYSQLQQRGACFGSKMGWERANFFAPSAAQARIEYGWGHQNWHAWVAAEHRACREAVAVFDMSSFAKLLLQGPGRTRRAAMAGRQRSADDAGFHGLHGNAERARRLRERLHDHLPRAGAIHDRHELRFRGPRPRRHRDARCAAGAQLFRDRHHDDVFDARGHGTALARTAAAGVDRALRQRIVSFRHLAGNRRRLRDGSCDAPDLRRRTGMGALRAGRVQRRRLRAAARGGSRPGSDGRWLLRDRFAAAGKGLSRLGTRTDTRRQPVRSRPGVRCPAGQDGLPRQARAAEVEECRWRGGRNAARRVAGGRCRAHKPLGRRACPAQRRARGLRHFRGVWSLDRQTGGARIAQQRARSGRCDVARRRPLHDRPRGRALPGRLSR